MKKVSYLFRETWMLARDSLASWWERDPFRSSVVISYYTIFSLPGLGLIVINLAGFFYGTEAISQQISEQVGEMIDQETALTIERIIANAYENGGLTASSIISFGVLLFGATGVFYQIQQSLNIMWNVEPQPDQQLLKYLFDRLFSFGMILMIGFMLLVSLVISSLLSGLGQWLSDTFFGLMDIVLMVLKLILSLGVITILFAAIYKFMPDVKIRWKDVWVGAFTAAMLFIIAEYFLGLYFAMGDPGSIYGAAGSIILIMLWTTYNALILLYGAEVTRNYARRHGVKIEPSDHAEYKTDKYLEER